MTTKTFLTIAWLCTCLPALPQSGKPDFDHVTTADLALKECAFEKDAAAFYLLNYAKINFKLFTSGFYKVTTERKIRIKILNQKGFEYANVLIPHLGNKKTSKITDLDAFIYSLDSSGNIVKTKVEKKDIFKSQVTRTNNLNTVKFTFPDLKPGCIIEYSYEHVENETYDIDPWIFQSDIPVAASYCEVNYPNFSILDYRLGGQLAVNGENYREWAIDSTKDTYKKVFFMKDIPSFKIEPLMTSVIDNLKRIEFSMNPVSNISMSRSTVIPTEKRWSSINSRLLGSYKFGMQFNIDIPGTEKIIDSIKQLKTSLAKIDAVYQCVKKQVAWDGHQTMYPGDINEVWKSGSGNSAEINIIILNLLNKLGINCCPVLISTRANGKTDTRFAHTSQFNGLDVLVVDSANYYVVDGSIKNQSFLIPPLNVLNRNVFAIMPDKYQWLNIADNRPLIRDSVYLTATLDKDGELKGEAINTFFDLSRRIRLSEDDEQDDLNKDLTNDAPDFKIDTSWSINKDSESLPLIEHVQYHFSLPHTGNLFFLKPYLLNALQKNPFKDSTRSTDVDFGCNQRYVQITRISLPPEMIIENIPKSVIIRTADTSIAYSRKISQRANVLVIENEFSINQSLYTPDEYPILWAFFKKAYGLLIDGIVLNKKE